MVDSIAAAAGQMQLREWLLTLLDLNTISGLEWVDRDQQIFSIAWRHASTRGWACDTDSKLFKEWAVYKKRYEPGDDERNAKLWKSRFRCALNALSDIKELRNLSRTKGENAKKIYQFLHKPHSRKLQRQQQRQGHHCGCNGSTGLNYRKRKNTSCSVANAVHCSNPAQPYIVGPYKWSSLSTGLFENEDEELEWLLYETQRVMCKSATNMFPFGEDITEEDMKIEDFLTPKVCI